MLFELSAKKITVIHNPAESWVIVETSAAAASFQLASVMKLNLPDNSFNAVRWLQAVADKHNLTVTFY